MSSLTDAGTCDFPVRPSRLQALLLVLSHVVALGALWWAALDSGLQLALSVALLCSLVDAFVRRCRVRRVRSVGRWWRLDYATGTGDEPCALQGPIFSLQHLVILRFRTPAGVPVIVPVFADSTGRDDHRRLRMFLRINHSGAV